MRLVELSLAGVDAHLAEERFHAEGARLVGDYRHDAFADGLVFQQVRQYTDESHGRRDFAPVGAGKLLLKELELRRLDQVGFRFAHWVITSERPAAFVQVDHLRAVFRRQVELRGLGVLFGDRQVEAPGS